MNSLFWSLQCQVAEPCPSCPSCSFLTCSPWNPRLHPMWRTSRWRQSHPKPMHFRIVDTVHCLCCLWYHMWQDTVARWFYPSLKGRTSNLVRTPFGRIPFANLKCRGPSNFDLLPSAFSQDVSFTCVLRAVAASEQNHRHGVVSFLCPEVMANFRRRSSRIHGCSAQNWTSLQSLVGRKVWSEHDGCSKLLGSKLFTGWPRDGLWALVKVGKWVEALLVYFSNFWSFTNKPFVG